MPSHPPCLSHLSRAAALAPSATARAHRAGRHPLTLGPQVPKGDPKVEKPGHITSDSLAAESLSSGGGFAANIDGKTSASSVPSGSTTANVADTSGANVLPPAPSASERQTGSAREEPSTPASRADVPASALGSSASTAGVTQPSSSTSGSSSGASGATRGGPSDAGAAPSAYSSAGGSEENLKPKPHGTNITEGGFDADAPNASFNNEIGGKNDPGRVAEQAFDSSNAKSGADAGFAGAYAAKETGSDKGGFEKLNSSEAA